MNATLKMLAFPLIGFALASAGAVSTSKTVENEAAQPPMTGYILNAQGGCGQAVNVNCNLVSGPVCTSAGQFVWHKDAQGNCVTLLRQDPIN